MYFRNTYARFVFVASLAVFACVAHVARAEERAYSFDSISQVYTVSPNSTVTVEEKLTYRFIGRYMLGYREIVNNRLSAISNVEVFDGDTGALLRKSNKRLPKSDPASSGAYTVYDNQGKTIVEWYYDLSDTTHEWIIRYTLHGSVSFLKTHDELYWNLFTNYEVPIEHVEGAVVLPKAQVSNEDVPFIFYSSVDNPLQQKTIYLDENRRVVRFSIEHVVPYQKLTIAVGWPKGLVTVSAFWKDFLLLNLPTVISVLAILLTLVGIALRWYFTERYHMGRGVIVPEYEPAQGLHPAEIEVITKERVSATAWSATMVDLAVRGYVRILEEEAFQANAFMRFVKSTLSPFVTLPSDYVVTRTDKSLENLLPYERDFLDALVSPTLGFSTQSLSENPARQRDIFRQIELISNALYKEVEEKTGAYAVTISSSKNRALILFLMFLSVVLLLLFGGDAVRSPVAIGFGVLVICVVVFVSFVRYEPRLNESGAELKEHLIGFKLYLQTAERYRLQNLTPETFERYLPYAIIFGVEKQWGKAFEGISLAPPTWYSGPTVLGGSSISGGTGNSLAGFSASAFSASFSSSFSSAFSSSGGGGASGGGGGAGGGGGGGGGGAS